MLIAPFYRLLLGLALVCVMPIAHAATEAELRAAVIYNIARFVSWPPSTTNVSHFTLCTLGNNAVTEALAALEGKQINSLPTTIRPIRRDHDLSNCHALYVSAENTVRMTAISDLLASNHAATLTISDAPSFLALGGMVQLVVVAERQRFRINQDLAGKANISINAKLLQLALPGGD